MTTKRQPLNMRQKARLLESQHWLCAVETCRVRIGNGFGDKPFEDDHWTPIHLGGTNELSNRRLICVRCHAEKTAGEKKMREKVDRLKFGRTRRGPPVPGSRNTRFKKHMDGSVSER